MLLRLRHRMDVVSVLTLYVVLLLGVPAQLIFEPLGAAGTPANLVGMACLLWWVCGRLVARLGLARGSQPIRVAIALLAVSVIISYAAGMRRPIIPEEIRAADRGLLSLLSWAGVALLAADGIRSRARLDVLMRRLVGMATLLAVLGVLQFALRLDIAAALRIPGLHVNGDFAFISQRSTFRRVAGTASHPIEFGVVLAMALPVALSKAFSAEPGWRLRRWLQVVVIGAAIPMSVSRSGIVGVIAAGLMLVPSWDRRRRIQAYKVIPVFLVSVRLLVPGLLGTITDLFIFVSSDTSTKGRTVDYAAVAPLVGNAPFFGRGFHTYIPTLYRWLDNQYLMSVVETGFVGLAALLLMLLIAIFTARGARRRSRDPGTRDLAQSFAAAFAAALVSFATFDALSFPMCDGLLFLLLGCAGALWRFQVAAADPDRISGYGPPHTAAVPATHAG